MRGGMLRTQHPLPRLHHLHLQVFGLRMFKDLETERGQYAVKKVKDYPLGLPKLYDHKMTRIENETKHRQHCKDVLVATFLAPLVGCCLAARC
jgi:hypothetical protein